MCRQVTHLDFWKSVNWRINSNSVCLSVAVKLSEIVEEIKQAAEYVLNMASKLGVRYCWQATLVTLGRVLSQAYP